MRILIILSFIVVYAVINLAYAQQHCEESDNNISLLDTTLCFPEGYVFDVSKIDSKFITIKSFGLLSPSVKSISKNYNSVRIGSLEQLQEEKDLSNVGGNQICGEFRVTYFKGNPIKLSNENYEVIIISSDKFFMEYIVNDRNILYDSLKLYKEESGCISNFLQRKLK